jgi:protein-S-isoprenylcysteine O-methyltransferase
VNAAAAALQQEDIGIPAVLEMYDKQFLPGQHKSLSGIATRSFILGCSLTLSLGLALHLVLTTDSPLWRVPFFISILSLFHFLEFWTTARYNTRAAQISSFLLSQNGSAYNIAHTTAIIECGLSHYLFPDRQWLPPVWHRALLFLGLGLVVLGQAVRSGAMIAAGTNFNHIIQRTKASSHQLVTTGIYGYLRHPSYFGFFWWGLGTQLVLGNAVCFVGFAVVLWNFFYRRIQGEEKLLVGFFGDEYVAYRKRTQVGIPFIR